MIAMILAAGLGTRMRPLTLLRAKPVLPVLNRPLLHWTLQALRRAGVRDVVVNTHHRPASIRSAVGDGRSLGLRVRWSQEPRILGSIGGVRKARRWLGEAPFLLLNGDMVFDFDLSRLVRRRRALGACAAVSLQRHPRRGRYGSVVTDPRDRVLSFSGWPRPARGRAWHFTGIQVLEPRLLEGVPRGYAETARDLYGPLIDSGGHVAGVVLEGPWYDLSSPPLYLASQMDLLQQGFGNSRGGVCVHPSARIHPSARVRGSVIGAGSSVGAGARVEGSVLWERVRVGAGARVRRSILTDRVLVESGDALAGVIAMPSRPHGARGGRLRHGRWELGLGR